MDRLHPLCLLLTKFPLHEGVGGGSRTPSPTPAWQQHGQGPEQVHWGGTADSLSSPSSWDYQLGLGLRSRWDIEITDCP